jgi:hypothetical protein
MDLCVGLVDMNPTQLEQAQMDVICSRYGDLFILPNKQKNDHYTICTVRIADVECTVGANVAGFVQMTWKDNWAYGRLTWTYRWTNWEVTHVTTARVTHGMFVRRHMVHSYGNTWHIHTMTCGRYREGAWVEISIDRWTIGCLTCGSSWHVERCHVA